MKLNDPKLADQPATDYDKRLQRSLYDLLRPLIIKVNAVAGGRAAGFDDQGTAAPATGTWAAGDRIRNSAPAVLGAAGSQYVVDGWVCTVGGTPGTWVAQRTLTGT